MTDPALEFDCAQICSQTAVRRVELHNELPSTNDLALDLAIAAPATDLPLLVLAVCQTRGRGRGDHCWWSTDGALTFSLILDTEALQLVPRRWPRISLVTGIAVANTILGQLPMEQGAMEQIPSHEVRVKWPNDIFVDRRKICGILTENASRQPHRLVVGIGLNVNNSWSDASVELRKIGTSLVDVADRQFSRQVILVDFLQRLHQSLTDLARDAFPLTEAWRALCMLEGNTVTVDVGGIRTTGVCQGIDDDGALLLQNESGIQHCVAGTVAEIH
ncbi:MAG: biotin--[acetyl-CoA-carboxylase] ligase [Pirellulaceae bacterium]|jgi:BirA family biotin operon repressor/biotin-[acetyl-CoA-carboxylase] ligase|nr:biotin--[acetyl-CoA-carboxylase] ligase [Pirellulaceae bacterium]MDP6558356.1 biotin--[acetyl-CoA-carboxylase] ligase [Pirellulaceae bacterium]